MDDYTNYRDEDGWIESNIRVSVDHFMAFELAGKPALCNQLRMMTWIHNTHPPPEYPYTRAVSSHSVVIQLYARSGQLPTAETLEARSKIDSKMCRLCRDGVESMHHIFVTCNQFNDWRREAAMEVETRTARKLLEAGVPEEGQLHVLRAANILWVKSQRRKFSSPRLCSPTTLSGDSYPQQGQLYDFDDPLTFPSLCAFSARLGANTGHGPEREQH